LWSLHRCSKYIPVQLPHHRNLLQTIRDRIRDCSESVLRGDKAIEWLEQAYKNLTTPFAQTKTFYVSNKNKQLEHDEVLYEFHSFAHVLNSLFFPSNT
jgi:hypothetical protein